MLQWQNTRKGQHKQQTIVWNFSKSQLPVSASVSCSFAILFNLDGTCSMKTKQVLNMKTFIESPTVQSQENSRDIPGFIIKCSNYSSSTIFLMLIQRACPIVPSNNWCCHYLVWISLLFSLKYEVSTTFILVRFLRNLTKKSFLAYM